MHEHQTEIIIFIIAFFAVFIAFFLGIVLFVQHGKKSKTNFITEKETLKTNHIQELLSTQLEMQTQTMQHIGREIHDSVGQKLTLASLYTQQLAYENKAPQITDKIENIGSIINESLKELRQLSKTLTDDTITENDIVSLLQNECEKVNALQKATVIFTSSIAVVNLDYQHKNILLRVVQEFLQNSIKHAECKKITISFSKKETSIIVRLIDDGKGFDKYSIKQNGIGLANMEKRIGIIGGKFQLESVLQKGTILNIEIPL